MYWNKRIYYDVTYGDPVQETGGFKSARDRYSVEYEISIYPNLSERNRESFAVLELEYGQYDQDFADCSGYRVNPETLELEFSYPDPNEPEVEQPFVKPLTDQIEEVRNDMDTAILELTMVIAMQGGGM